MVSTLGGIIFLDRRPASGVPHAIFSRRRLVCKAGRGLSIMVHMKRRMVIMAFVTLACGCDQEPAQAPQVPPAREKAAVRSPVEEIGRALLQGGPEDRRKALAGILGLDEATKKQHQKTLHDFLRHCLSGEDPDLRKEAALAFVKLEDGLSALVRSLDLVPESDEDVLGVALEAIEAILKSDDPGLKLRAVDLLSEIGRPAVGLLLKTLEDENADIRLGALDALWSIGSIEPEFARRISPLLKDPDPRVRRAAEAAVDRLREDREGEERPPQRPVPPRPKGG